MNQEFFEDIEAIKNSQKTQTTLAFIRTIASLLALATVIVSLVIFMPRILNTMEQMDSTLASVDSMVSEADGAISAIKGTLSSDGAIPPEGLEELAEAIEKINSIDFDKLNESINSLQKVVSGLSGFTSIFGR